MKNEYEICCAFRRACLHVGPDEWMDLRVQLTLPRFDSDKELKQYSDFRRDPVLFVAQHNHGQEIYSGIINRFGECEHYWVPKINSDGGVGRKCMKCGVEDRPRLNGEHYEDEDEDEDEDEELMQLVRERMAKKEKSVRVEWSDL